LRSAEEDEEDDYNEEKLMLKKKKNLVIMMEMRKETIRYEMYFLFKFSAPLRLAQN
jgi:hypothetical protein